MSGTLKRKYDQSIGKKKYAQPKDGERRKKENNNHMNKITFENENEEIDTLNERIVNETPASGSQPRSDGKLRFDSLPLSKRTLFGLSTSKMEIATEIQAASIPHALAGRDILGAAKTGSGKTLAFVIPLLEKLFREKWTSDDGLAAIIISPTRELAFQIFEVIRMIGKKHLFSAGLITGGKKEFPSEQERIIRMNILVATPGRLLQHFEQTLGFDASQLLMLILDEADRILDMGFKTQLDSILGYLPLSRQTLLFSATQTKSVKDLARLSLNHPEYVAVHAEDQEVTPKQLIQNYILTSLPQKLDVLFSFIKSHVKAKMIIFFSTCAQVRFIYECFRSMQPGVILMALHGKVKQEKRMIIYNEFLKRPAACMLATDIAARGLDFPNVDWVVQADAPEDAAMYIHRVGRTARYNSGGRALLLLMPHEEEPVLKVLTNALVPIKKLTVNPNRTFSVSSSAAALLAAHPDYRNYAKKAFVGYLRSLQLLSSYPVKDIKSLPLNEFANALGLPMTPELPNLQAKDDVDEAREDVRKKKNVNRALDKLKKQIQAAKEAKRLKREEKKANRVKVENDDSASDLSSSSDDEDSDGTMTDGSSEEDEDSIPQQKKNTQKKDKKLSVHQMKIDIEKKRLAMESNQRDNNEDEEDDDFLAVKQVHRWGEQEDNSESQTIHSGKDAIANISSNSTKTENKVAKVKITKDGKLKNTSSHKLIFDEDGNPMDLQPKLVPIQQKPKSEIELRVEQHASQLKEKIDSIRQEDHLRDKQRIREKKLQRKQQIKALKEHEDFGPVAVLADPVEEASLGEEEEGDGDEEFNRERSSDQEEDDEFNDRHYGSDQEGSEDSDSNEEDANDDDEDDGNQKRNKKPRLSIEQQEKLALAILHRK